MKEVINLATPEVTTKIVDSPIPEPESKQVLIKVIVSGSNPKDWKAPVFAIDYKTPDDGTMMARSSRGVNQGDDIAGIVEKVGADVIGFKKGDRVASFHEMAYPGGSYAEYALGWDWTTFHIPESISFEEAATIPLAAYTAAVALFRNLQLPTPWNPATTPTPFIVYGASTAVGAYAVKLAINSNIHPIIAIAGKASDFVKTIIDESKGDKVFDYRSGSEEMISQIQKHLESGSYGPVMHGLDPGIGKSGEKVLNTIVAPNGAINLVMPSDTVVASATKTDTSVGVVHDTDNGGHGADARDLGLVMSAWFTKSLQSGQFNGHPFEVKEGGLAGVEQALRDLKDGKNSGVKYVFRIADTPGL